MIKKDIAAHKWRGQHKGVAWEVSHHAMGHELITTDMGYGQHTFTLTLECINKH